MTENTIITLSITGLLVLIVLIILFANWIDYRIKRKQSLRFKKDMESGNYNSTKKYFGNQGGWDKGDDTYDHNDHNRA